MSNGNGTSTAIVRPGAEAYQQAGGAIQRQGFGSYELEVSRETQGAAAAEQAKALVQARFIMAMQRPRDVEDVRVRLLKHCRRPRFAEIAEYSKPVGGQSITGPSIRFVETALQEYGNVTIDTAVVYDDEEKRVVRVSVADLERNIPYTEDATIEKYVERRDPKGGEVISERRNKQGQTVYRVRANEDDYANKLAAAVSKKIRNLGLRILPADIVDEAIWECSETRRKQVKDDPDAAIRKMADAFARLNITPAALKEYLGHELGQATADELDTLRKIGIAIKDGETTWTATLEAKRGERGEGAPAAVDKVADGLKAKLAQAPAGDRPGTEKPAGKKPKAPTVTWRREDNAFTAAHGDYALTVEQTGPTTIGWWVTLAGADEAKGEIEGEGAAGFDKAKAAALEAAAKL